MTPEQWREEHEQAASRARGLGRALLGAAVLLYFAGSVGLLLVVLS